MIPHPGLAVRDPERVPVLLTKCSHSGSTPVLLTKCSHSGSTPVLLTTGSRRSSINIRGAAVLRPSQMNLP
jgi:hypothetical protein